MMEYYRRSLLAKLLTAVSGGVITFLFLLLGGTAGPLLWIIPLTIVVTWAVVGLTAFPPSSTSSSNHRQVP